MRIQLQAGPTLFPVERLNGCVYDLAVPIDADLRGVRYSPNCVLYAVFAPFGAKNPEEGATLEHYIRAAA